MNKKQIVGLGVALVLVLAIVTLVLGGFGYNEDHEWQVLQYPRGTVEIIDNPGYYMKWFGTEKTWPRAMQFPYEGIRVTFNDGGTATVTGIVRIQLPTSPEDRRKLNREFSANPTNLKLAVDAHITNVLKATAPTMSASEHQTSRKGEFQALVFKQTQDGIYKMKRKEQIMDDDDTVVPVVVAPNADGTPGTPLVIAPVARSNQRTIFTTEIVLDDDGQPLVDQVSPLKGYQIAIVQLSVGDVDYDDKTLEMFDAKKESFLLAEKSKAERLQEYEQTLMVVQKGQREKAEAEAKANVEKATAVIQAELKAEVALQTKIEAETKAEELLAVAALSKQTAETKAEELLSVATFGAQAAEQEAKAITTLAAAEEERIVKAGAMTEEKEKTLEILSRMQIGIAEALSKVNVPAIVMQGGKAGDGSETSQKEALMNLYLLKQLGVLDGPLKKQLDAAVANDAVEVKDFK